MLLALTFFFGIFTAVNMCFLLQRD